MRVALKSSGKTVAVLAALSLAAAAAPVHSALAAGPPADGAATQAESGQRYIVTLRHGSLGRGLAGEYGSKGARVRHVYSHALQGFAAEMSPGLLAQLRVDKRIASVELDQEVSAEETVQTSPTWGLDRVDQRALPLSKTYTYSASGKGVTAYVLDTGVRSTHGQFTGRLAAGYDAVAGSSTEDCYGHGTHVAGTLAGSTYGVAKGATVVPVRVLRCDGSGSWSDVVEGVDWVTGHHQGTAPAVAVMSIGGGTSSATDTAVRASVADGVVYAVSAGNSSKDACVQSPARVAEVLTTAASDSTDTKRSTSNFGQCVDLFAPGTSVLSALHTSDTATGFKSGTSMAAPHVAGAAAVWLEAHPLATPQEVMEALRAAATPNVIKSAGTGSPNRLLYSPVGSDAATPTEPAPVLPPPTEPAPTQPDPGIALTVSPYKVKGAKQAQLSWSGASTTQVDLRRDGRVVATTSNDGTHVDVVGGKGSGQATYAMCEAGRAVCSTPVTVTW